VTDDTDGHASADAAETSDQTAAESTPSGEATDTETDGSARNRYPRNTAGGSDAEFDWRGWVLVATIGVAFLVIPGLLYLLPAARDTLAGLGLGWQTTYLVAPLVPAFLLGALAVWSAVRSRN